LRRGDDRYHHVLAGIAGIHTTIQRAGARRLPVALGVRRLDGKLLKLGAGDVLFVPRGTPHGFVSLGPEVGRQIIINSLGESSMQ
jgi:mannose-6-phosphate isomerase-like protein (cupin superfamily)